MIDYTRAATKAYETIMKYGVCKTPVAPLSILERMGNVDPISFDELGCRGIVPVFGKCGDALTSIRVENGRNIYVITYNNLLPFNILQRAFAREMGHVVLGHTERSSDNEAEAQCFAQHLLCPRPLLHIIQAISMRVTEDLVENLTGVQNQFIVAMRRTPGVAVPAKINRFVSNLFLPFAVNFYEFYRDVKPFDGSALADFGTYMDNYEE